MVPEGNCNHELFCVFANKLPWWKHQIPFDPFDPFDYSWATLRRLRGCHHRSCLVASVTTERSPKNGNLKQRSKTETPNLITVCAVHQIYLNRLICVPLFQPITCLLLALYNSSITGLSFAHHLPSVGWSSEAAWNRLFGISSGGQYCFWKMPLFMVPLDKR